MLKRLERFGVLQTAKFVAILYFLMTAVFAVIFFVVSLFAPGVNNPFKAVGVMVLILPFLYGLLSFIFTAIFCFVYNFTASKIGGIEFHLSDHHKP